MEKSVSTTLAMDDDLSNSRFSTSSIGSRSSPRKSSAQKQNARLYKIASSQFLTRSFRDAYDTLHPLLFPSSPLPHSPSAHVRAPILAFDQKLRVKVLSLYVTLLNTIVELPPSQARSTIGKDDWNQIVGQVESGRIWSHIVDAVYDGKVAMIDTEVIVNLVNLLLAHAQNTKKVQEYLETYLSAMDDPTTQHEPVASGETPRSLEKYLEVIELYALHVLPRNDDYDHARGFLEVNALLDDERRDVLIETLNELEQEQRQASQETSRYNHLKSISGLPNNLYDMTRTDSEATIRPSNSRLQRISSNDCSSITPAVNKASLDASKEQPLKRLTPQPMLESAGDPSPSSNSRLSGQVFSTSNASKIEKASSTERNSQNAGKRRQPSSLTSRTFQALAPMRTTLTSLAGHLSQNPASLLRFVFFLLAFLVMLSKRKWRAQFAQSAALGWLKVKESIGMGLKVSSV